MKVFLDTNVLLEYLMRREQVDIVERLIGCLQRAGDEMYMSAGGFYSILYVMDNYFRKELEIKNPERTAAIRAIAKQLLSNFRVAEHSNDSLLDGVCNETFVDLEDGCQYHVALKTECEYLLTFNIKHYPVGTHNINVLTPSEFMSFRLADGGC